MNLEGFYVEFTFHTTFSPYDAEYRVRRGLLVLRDSYPNNEATIYFCPKWDQF
jgi:hypothetical protein